MNEARRTLSTCMIVRDEADVLGIALACVAPIADQLVVVDTGSRDATMDVARRFGAELHQLEWGDDFSAARNASLALARGEWILVLDADEWLDEDATREIRDLVDNADPTAFLMPQRNYVADGLTPGLVAGEAPSVWGVEAAGFTVARQIRLFSRHPSVSYVGRVHEQIEESVQAAGLSRCHTEIVFHHVGKLRDEAKMARKAELYRLLGERKLEENPDPRAHLELGVQCIELGEDERACALLEDCVCRTDAAGDRAKAVSHLAGVYSRQGHRDRAIELIETHLATIGGYAMVWERWASVLAEQKRFARAIEVLEEATRHFPAYAGLLRMLGEASLALRRFDRAERAYARLIELSGEGRLGRAGWAVARAGRGDNQPLRAILDSGDDDVRRSAVAGAMGWLGPEALLRVWPHAAPSGESSATESVLASSLRKRGRAFRPVDRAHGPEDPPRTVESFWRAARMRHDLDPAVRVRILTGIGVRPVAESDPLVSSAD